jgi:hypothetical protein
MMRRGMKRKPATTMGVRTGAKKMPKRGKNAEPMMEASET